MNFFKKTNYTKKTLERKKSSRNLEGFTMIELMVTIAVISILSGALLGIGDEKQFSLRRSTYTLSQDLRETQEMAMGGKTDCGGKSTYMYGCHFDSSTSTYFIFADCNKDKGYAANDKIIKKKKLEDKVNIDKLSKKNLSSGSVSEPNELDIVFVSPEPAVFINGDEWGWESIISLSFKNETSSVKVNSAGRIERR